LEEKGLIVKEGIGRWSFYKLSINIDDKQTTIKQFQFAIEQLEFAIETPFLCKSSKFVIKHQHSKNVVQVTHARAAW
jgi:hypothetical protein